MIDIDKYYNIILNNSANLLNIKNSLTDIKKILFTVEELILDNYIVIKVDSETKKKIFIIYSVHYMLKYLNSIKYIGLDYEFDKNKIALGQFGFYEKIKKEKHIYNGIIFVTNPNDYTQSENKIIIKSIYTSKLWKILHGADSLDIPYIYSLLEN